MLVLNGHLDDLGSFVYSDSYCMTSLFIISRTRGEGGGMEER